MGWLPSLLDSSLAPHIVIWISTEVSAPFLLSLPEEYIRGNHVRSLTSTTRRWWYSSKAARRHKIEYVPFHPSLVRLFHIMGIEAIRIKGIVEKCLLQVHII